MAETDVVRDSMIKFERAVVDQAKQSAKAHEPEWVVGTLNLLGRLCCSLRAALPKE